MTKTDVLNGHLIRVQQRLETALLSVNDMLSDVQLIEDATLAKTIAALPKSTTKITPHRSVHKSGRVPVLETDPVLRAFVIARFDRLTFQQIADEVKAHFPKDQRIGKSAIHNWWQKNYSTPDRSG